MDAATPPFLLQAVALKDMFADPASDDSELEPLTLHPVAEDSPLLYHLPAKGLTDCTGRTYPRHVRFRRAGGNSALGGWPQAAW